MTAGTSPQDRVIDFLGDLGPRWGLPGEACRVHGYLYLAARPVAEADLREAVGLNDPAFARALDWLAEYGLIERARPDAWRTGSDPWELMLRALQERQRREVGPALELLRDCRRAALAEGGAGRPAARQIEKLVRLVEDIAAINSQAQRLSPTLVRQMVGLGGFAARVLDRTLGRRKPT
jgi:DNA-binding transcriptional regulator GbsR (MarR family)